MKPSKFNRFATVATLLSLSCTAFAVDRVRNTAATSLINAAAWDTLAPNASDRAVWNSTSAGGANTLGGNASWGGILISAGTPSSVSFTNAANPSIFTLSLGSGGIDLNGGTSTNRGLTFESNTRLDLTATQTWKLGLGGTSANLVVSSIVSGTGALTITRDVAGSNYAQFAGANTFSGGFTAGANSWVRVAGNSVTSGTTVTNGALGTGQITLNDGALLSSASGTGYLIAVPQINIAGNITLAQATGGTGRLQIAGTWELGGATRTVTLGKASTGTGAPYASGLEVFNFNRPTTGGNFSVPTVQNGNLNLVTTTGSAATPSVARIGSGGTTSFANNAGLSLGDGVALTSGTGTFFGTGTNAPALTLAAPVSNGGGILQMGDGTNAGNAVMRNAEVYSLSGGGIVSASNSSGTTTTGTLTISNGNGANFSGSIVETGGTGKIALTKTGAGTQTLSGVSSYTGKTTVSGGVLRIAKTTALYNNTPASWTDANLQVDSGATLAFNVGGSGEFSASDIQSLAALGTATGGFKTGARIGIDTTNASGGVFTYSNVLANPNSGANALGLRKLGTGDLVLDQANTFTGGTTVESGMLVANNTTGSATGTGTLNVSTGAALGGAGIISGATTISGSVRPGNSIGTLTVGNDVTWNAGSAWVFELGASSVNLAAADVGGTRDLLDLTGAGSDFLKGSGTGWTFDFAGTGATGWYKIVDWTGTTTFSSSDFSAVNLPSGLSGSFTVDGATSALYLNVVPEPSSAAIGGLGLLALLRRRRC